MFFPTIQEEDTNCARCKGAGHPLLNLRKVFRMIFIANEQFYYYNIQEANMAGKSTFLANGFP